MDHRLVHLPAITQDEAQVVLGVDVVGPGFQHLAEMEAASSIRPQPTKAAPRLLWASA